ncbi:MAG: metal-dependent transcriptional regulator, partial [Acidobacteria bacterium]|nr:metal-dependent transcriptional regulator [Acidobacteriota bacterium]
MNPTSSTEDYLKAILLEHEVERGPRIPPGRLAERLGVAPGSVTAMLKSLAVRALVHYEPYGGVALTPEGQRIAVAVLRRHRLIELFLVEVLGMDWSEVHAEAERLEHHVSERVLSRIDAVLGSPSVDPHGDPI